MPGVSDRICGWLICISHPMEIHAPHEEEAAGGVVFVPMQLRYSPANPIIEAISRKKAGGPYIMPLTFYQIAHMGIPSFRALFIGYINPYPPDQRDLHQISGEGAGDMPARPSPSNPIQIPGGWPV